MYLYVIIYLILTQVRDTNQTKASSLPLNSQSWLTPGPGVSHRAPSWMFTYRPPNNQQHAFFLFHGGLGLCCPITPAGVGMEALSQLPCCWADLLEPTSSGPDLSSGSVFSKNERRRHSLVKRFFLTRMPHEMKVEMRRSFVLPIFLVTAAHLCNRVSR